MYTDWHVCGVEGMRYTQSYGVEYTWNGTLHEVGHILGLGPYTERDTQGRTHTHRVRHIEGVENTEWVIHAKEETRSGTHIRWENGVGHIRGGKDMGWDIHEVGNIRGGTHTRWNT